MAKKLLSGGRVLVVGHNEEKRSKLDEIIRKFGFETMVSDDLEESEDLCRTFRPEAVVFYVEKPGEFRFRSAKNAGCKKIAPLPSFIIVHPPKAAQGKVGAIAEGADEFLAWPVVPEELAHRLEAAVRYQHSLHESEEFIDHQEDALKTLRWYNAEYAREFEEAREVQRALCPVKRLALNGFVINTSIKATQKLNGDFIDIIRMDSLRVVLVLMDVSGHGAAAAMVTGMAHSWLRSNIHDRVSLVSMIEEFNRYLYTFTPGPMYATGFIGILDTITGDMEYVLAGHPEPLFWRNGVCSPGPEASTPPLGLYQEFKAVVSRSRMGPADAVMVYSDGLLDAFSESEAPLKMVCSLYHHHNLGLCLRNRTCCMVDDILKQGRMPRDDMSMICIKRLPSPICIGRLQVSIPETGRYEFNFPSMEDAMMDLYSFMVDHLKEEAGEELFWDMLQVAMELLKNAIEWGNERNPAKKVLCTVSMTSKEIVLTVEDEGTGFDTALVLERCQNVDPDQVHQVHVDGTRPGGLGLYLALGLADRLSFNTKGNRVEARFVRKQH